MDVYFRIPMVVVVAKVGLYLFRREIPWFCLFFYKMDAFSFANQENPYGHIVIYVKVKNQIWLFSLQEEQY